MRRRYFKSHIKLSIILILIISPFAVAKKKDIETNIVCFAAKNKWICAPEDQQNIASEKATKLLDAHASEIGSSEVVIKSINIPKFNSSNSYDSFNAAKIEPKTPSETNQQIDTEQASEKTDKQAGSNIKLKDTTNNNPYAKLWSHQLIGVSTHQSAINYVKKMRLNKDDVLILKSSRANMDWWIVLFGLYKDKQTGIDNAINLPSNIDPPWLRPLRNLEVKGFVESY